MKHGVEIFKTYIPYIIGALAGFFFCPVMMTLKGYDYSANGHDLLNALMIIALIYLIKFVWRNRK